MGSKDSTIYTPALTIVSQCFSLEVPNLIDIGLQRDVLSHYHELLGSSDTTCITEALWGLSNITASTKDHIYRVFMSEDLVDSVLTFMSHSHERLRAEALYVISNAINAADSNHLKRLLELKGCSLVEPMTQALERGHEADLILNILEALTKLLDLDSQYSEVFNGHNTVCITIESVGGFDKVESLLKEKNRDVFLAAQNVMNRYQDATAVSSTKGYNLSPLPSLRGLLLSNGTNTSNELAQINRQAIFEI